MHSATIKLIDGKTHVRVWTSWQMADAVYDSHLRYLRNSKPHNLADIVDADGMVSIDVSACCVVVDWDYALCRMKQGATYKVFLETPSGEVIVTDDATVAAACVHDWDSYRAENSRMVLSVCLPDDVASGQTRVSWWHVR